MNGERRETVLTNYMKRKRGDRKRRQTVWGSYIDEEILQDKKSQQSSSTGIELPDDIVAEILGRLPVKSLCRFKCLNKTWCNRFSDSHFVKLHLKQSIKANRFTYTLYARDLFPIPGRMELEHEAMVNGQEAKPAKDTSLFDLTNRMNTYMEVLRTRDMWVRGCCNGLLCIYIEPDYLFLVNPSTRETKKILKPSMTRGLTTIYRFYNPTRELHVRKSTIGGFGFGYDALHDDYKVVTVNDCRDVKVYSLKTDSWSYRGKFPDYQYTYYMPKSVHLNGAIHWRNRSDNYFCITAFDLAREEFFHIPTPIPTDDDNTCYILETLRGCLCLIPRPSSFEEPRCDIWVKKEDSWENVSLTFSFRSLLPLNYLENEDHTLFKVDGRLFFLYNHRNGHRKQVNTVPTPKGYERIGLLSSFSYVESLVSPGRSRMSKSRKLRGRRKPKAQQGGDI